MDKKIPNDCNHLFISLEYDPALKTNNWSSVLKESLLSYEAIFKKLKIKEIEVSYKTPEKKFRILFTNQTGIFSEVGVYEITDGHLKVIEGSGKFDGKPADDKHEKIENVLFQKRRTLATRLGTFYCYDVPFVFGKSILDLWQEYKEQNPKAYERWGLFYFAQNFIVNFQKNC